MTKKEWINYLCDADEPVAELGRTVWTVEEIMNAGNEHDREEWQKVQIQVDKGQESKWE